MDVVRFDLTDRLDPWKKREVPCVDIRLNDEPLEALIREIELPFAEREEQPSIAGQYLGLELGTDIRAASHFMGGNDSHLLCEPESHTALMRCSECGDLWGWPLMARVAVLERFVIWTDFVQPHRAGGAYAGRSPHKWEYDGVKFTFDREEYEDALRRLDDQIAGEKASRPTQTLFEIKKLFRRARRDS